VKPWFDGKLDFAVPVRDLAGFGYPLVGGRLDYVGSRPVAALVYRRDQHEVQVFAWREDAPPSPPVAERRSGYAMLRWAEDGMVYWAISDIPLEELTGFVERFRTAR